MLPLWPQFVCATAENILAQLIAMDPQATTSLQKLQGKQLAFTLRELNVSLLLTASPQGIFFNQYHNQADCHISTDLASLRQLRDNSQLTRLIKNDTLQIEGDIQVAQQFSNFLQQLNPDWQQSLSRYVGDALAHKISKLLQHCHLCLQQQVAQLNQLTTELAQDELQLTPTDTELQLFSEQVSRLQGRTEQLSRQLQQLQE